MQIHGAFIVFKTCDTYKLQFSGYLRNWTEKKKRLFFFAPRPKRKIDQRKMRHAQHAESFS